MKRFVWRCAFVAIFLWSVEAVAQTRAQEVEAIESGESVPISEEGALEMPEDQDDADDIRDDNNPDDVGQEALGEEGDESP